MKHVQMLLFLCLTAISVQAQTLTPKLSLVERPFKMKYKLGETYTPKKEIALHLEQFHPQAHAKWNDADQAANNALGWSIIGITGILVGHFYKKKDRSSQQELGEILEGTNTRMIAYGIGAVGIGLTMSNLVVQKDRRRKAIRLYNQEYGY